MRKACTDSPPNWAGITVFLVLHIFAYFVATPARHEIVLEDAMAERQSERSLAISGLPDAAARLQMTAMEQRVEQCMFKPGFYFGVNLNGTLPSLKMRWNPDAIEIGTNIQQAERMCLGRLLEEVALTDPKSALELAQRAQELGYPETE